MAERGVDLCPNLISVETDGMRVVGLEQHPIGPDLVEDRFRRNSSKNVQAQTCSRRYSLGRLVNSGFSTLTFAYENP